MREILTVPNPILRRACQPVKKIDSEALALAQELRELLEVKHEGIIAVGIAAPQIGVSLRMFVYRNNPYTAVDSSLTVINPEVVYVKGDVTLRESCFSIPGKLFLLKRHKLVKIRGLGLDGNLHSYKGEGLIAQILLHEIDHLKGILIDKYGVEIDKYGQEVKENGKLG